MDNHFWLAKWETNEIPFHEQNVNSDLISYFSELNLNSGDCIFVPLCGKTKDMRWLAQQSFRIIGVELSPIACDNFFTELNVTPRITNLNKFTKYHFDNIELLCGDLFDLTQYDLPTINAVYDCKALIALLPEKRQSYIEHIVNFVGENIKILLFTRESPCKVNPPPYPISKKEVDLLYGSHFSVQQLKSLKIVNIPERYTKKGYTEMTEGIYLISGKI